VLGVCMILSIIFPSCQKAGNQTGEVVTLDAVSLEFVQDGAVASSTPTFYIAILAVGSALVAFYSLSQFRNRLTQIKLGALNSLLMAGVLGLILYFSRQGEDMLPQTNQSAAGFENYEIGFFLVIIAMICNILANRFIRRDEKLVRSADRMR
jgi:drug/metabolite transporter (DMT)-like permease